MKKTRMVLNSSRVCDIFFAEEKHDHREKHESDPDQTNDLQFGGSVRTAGGQGKDALSRRGGPPAPNPPHIDDEKRERRPELTAGRCPGKSHDGHLARGNGVPSDLDIVKSLQHSGNEDYPADADKAILRGGHGTEQPFAAPDGNPEGDHARAEHQGNEFAEADSFHSEHRFRLGEIIEGELRPADTDLHVRT
jgi:hypothetical protein